MDFGGGALWAVLCLNEICEKEPGVRGCEGAPSKPDFGLSGAVIERVGKTTNGKGTALACR